MRSIEEQSNYILDTLKNSLDGLLRVILFDSPYPDYMTIVKNDGELPKQVFFTEHDDTYGVTPESGSLVESTVDFLAENGYIKHTDWGYRITKKGMEEQITMGKTWELIGDEMGQKRNFEKHPSLPGYYCTMRNKSMVPDKYIPEPPSQSTTYQSNASSFFGSATSAGRDLSQATATTTNKWANKYVIGLTLTIGTIYLLCHFLIH